MLVNLAGDVAIAGPPPDGGWLIEVTDDHSASGPVTDDDGPTVEIFTGGLATSGTSRRRWRTGGVERHHIVDPRTGGSAREVWRTVSVAAASCVDANIASTAAIVLGDAAPRWLASRGLPARLVAADGRVQTVAGWPADIAAVAG